MTGPCFVDANVFVYSIDPREPQKRGVAREWLQHLWNEGSGRTGVQALSEYFATVMRKFRDTVSAEVAWARTMRYAAWSPQPVDFELLQRGRELQQRFRLSWWDSLIVAAAQAQNCSVLLSEDFSDGAVFDGVTVRSPFTYAVREAAATYAASQQRPRYSRRPSAMR
jgi:predicted nucleic acid-binding protein